MSIHDMSEDDLRLADSLLRQPNKQNTIWLPNDEHFILWRRHAIFTSSEVLSAEAEPGKSNMDIVEETKDAIFKDAQKKSSSDLMVIPRHPLMEGKPMDHLHEKSEELKLDFELGLRGQATITKKKIIDMDIQELMREQKYYPINLEQLKTLLEFPKLKWWNRWFNYKSLWKTNPVAMFFTHLLISIPVFATVMVSMFGIHFAPFYILCLFDFFLFLCFHELNDTEKLQLRTEDVRKTLLNIPMGAKLRLKEAMEGKAFDRFLIAYPSIAIKRNMEYDPAILGVNEIGDEEKWWMITYWDVKKNQEKKNSKIERFKRLKLRSYE